MTGARARLIAAAVQLVRARGFADVSLRELAAELGTSHRMLIYHFGSKDALFVEVIRAFEAEQREIITALVAADPDGGPELMRRIWRQVSAPEQLAQVQMFFRVCGHALTPGDDGATDHERRALLAGIVGDWVGPMAELERRRSGAPARQARADVRVGVAVMRGLLLDLLATGDRRGVDLAFERFLAAR